MLSESNHNKDHKSPYVGSVDNCRMFYCTVEWIGILSCVPAQLQARGITPVLAIHGACDLPVIGLDVERLPHGRAAQSKTGPQSHVDSKIVHGTLTPVHRLEGSIK